ncbi:MAG: hypothetical protein IPL26_10515 [Leptospiraceae bacterium]|nr:hypothetical protein [Leptospiraceae bacterium]
MKNRKPNRLKGFDYSSDNLYFITSCTKDRICWFGEIISNTMILNECGNIAQKQWFWLKDQYPYVQLHEFIVMPNHIHGIIEIVKSVGTGRDLSLRVNDPSPRKIKPLSELMGAYKTTVSKQIHLLENEKSKNVKDFAWQRSFHDHILRDEPSFYNISEYIKNNPINWKNDEFNKYLFLYNEFCGNDKWFEYDKLWGR